jgi:hypothetical protein
MQTCRFSSVSSTTLSPVFIMKESSHEKNMLLVVFLIFIGCNPIRKHPTDSSTIRQVIRPGGGGKIVETGSHQSLLDQKGLYYAMWRQQIGERRNPKP